VIPEWYHYCVAFTVRTDKTLDSALDALSASEGLSRQEIVRRAVLERYERSEHAVRVADTSSRMLARWHDVLERLGTE
jgi:predicted transcriptional regulator